MRKKIIIMSMILTIASCFVTGCGSKKNSSKDSGKNTASTIEETTTVKSVQEETVIVPSVVGTDEDTAKTVMLNNGFIPTVEEEFSDTVELGKVTRTSIEANQSVPKNSPIVIYVSKGGANFKPTSMKWSWTNCGTKYDDKWTIDQYSCMITDNVLGFEPVGELCDVVLGLAGVSVSAINGVPITIQCEVRDDDSYYTTDPYDDSILRPYISFSLDKAQTPGSELKSVTYDITYITSCNETNTVRLTVEYEWYQVTGGLVAE